MKKQDIPDKNIHVFTSCLFQTNTSLVILPNHALVVDPNYFPHELATIADFVHTHYGDRKIVLLFTHSDYDHIVGYGTFPKAELVIVSKPMAATSEERIQQILQEAQLVDATWYIERRPESLRFPVADIRIEEDGQTVVLDGVPLRFYFAPGHTADGLACFVGDVCICGDYLCDTEFPFIYDSFAAYKQTLQKFADLFALHQTQLLISGHGNIALGPVAIHERLGWANRYLQEIEHEAVHNATMKKDWLRQQYPFWKGIEKFHEDNLRLLRREIGPK
jgi:hydroxyacylglutathione hydrolase